MALFLSGMRPYNVALMKMTLIYGFLHCKAHSQWVTLSNKVAEEFKVGLKERVFIQFVTFYMSLWAVISALSLYFRIW